MDSIVLDYDRFNIQAQKALEHILSLGCFKLHTKEKSNEDAVFLAREKDERFLYSVSEQILAKDWLNKNEDEAWKNL